MRRRHNLFNSAQRNQTITAPQLAFEILIWVRTLPRRSVAGLLVCACARILPEFLVDYLLKTLYRQIAGFLQKTHFIGRQAHPDMSERLTLLLVCEMAW